MKEIILFGRALSHSSFHLTQIKESFENRERDKNCIKTSENREFIEFAANKGYIVHPNCDVKRVKEYLNTLPNNHNTTFYKSFDKVRNSTRFELLLDQIIHYMSTYGTNHEGEPYIPNEDPEIVDFTDCKMMLPIDSIEIWKKIDASFTSGIAIATDTIIMMLDLLEEVEWNYNLALLKEWKNKEAIVLYKLRTDLPPENNEEFIRMMVYICTGSTLIIKNNEVIREISMSSDFDRSTPLIKLFKDYDFVKLSQDFNRYKRLFLALKNIPVFNAIVNKLSKLSKKHHKPMVTPIGNVFLTKEWLNDTVKQELGLIWVKENLPNASIFQKEKWLQAIRKRLNSNPTFDCYNIRNGKSYFTINNNSYNKDLEQLLLTNYHTVIYNSMVEQMEEKVNDKDVYIPNGINFVVPTSEKNFINHIPFNSYIEIENQENAVIGITWKGDDGAQDLDLAYLNIDGDKIGWNGSFADDDGMVFSGDMTSARPEASEMFYCPKGIKDGIFSVNNYSGNPKSGYHFFIAKDHTDHSDKCIDPNNILFQTKLLTGSHNEEQSIGIFIDDIFFFTNRVAGRGRVSSAGDVSKMMIGYQQCASKFSTNLEKLLADAGADVWSGKSLVGYKDHIKPSANSIDLTTNDKTVLIELLS